MADALFTPIGDGSWQPNELARGPWDPAAQHKRARSARSWRERWSAPRRPGRCTRQRLTMELLRPVPLEPLTVTSRVVRPGRRVQLVEVSVATARDDVEVVQALALRISRRDVRMPIDSDPSAELPPPPEEGVEPELWNGTGQPAFHTRAVEHRFVRGQFAPIGPATDWIRLDVPLVPGEEPSPFQRVLAAADFGNGVGHVLDFERFTFVNPDLTVVLHRLPVDPWVCLNSVTHLGTEGLAVAESALFDRRGRIGRAVQTLVVGEV